MSFCKRVFPVISSVDDIRQHGCQQNQQISCHGFDRSLLLLVKSTANDLDDCFKTSILFNWILAGSGGFEWRDTVHGQCVDLKTAIQQIILRQQQNEVTIETELR